MYFPKISIVTPSYNQGQYIEETILSVINQNYPNLEYIIIDGGSTDNTIDIIKKYEKHLTYWVSEPDHGQSHAINKGLKKCTGDIFNWLNSDDYLEPEALFHVANKFKEKSNAKLVCGYNRRFVDDSKSVERHVRTRISNQLEKSIVFNSIDFRQSPSFFKLSCVKSLGGVNKALNYVMDNDLFLRFLLKYGQNEIYFIDHILVNYRLHQDSKTVADNGKFWNEFFNSVLIPKMKSIKRNEVKELPKWISRKKLLAYWYAYHALKTSRKNVFLYFSLLIKSAYMVRGDLCHLSFLFKEVMFYRNLDYDSQ